MNKNGTYLVITPFFPSNKSFVGSYVYDQITEIKNQSNFSIEIVKVVSYFSFESDYEFNGFNTFSFFNNIFLFFISLLFGSAAYVELAINLFIMFRFIFRLEF